MRRRGLFLLVAFLVAITAIILRPRDRTDDPSRPPVPEEGVSPGDAPGREPISSGSARPSRESLRLHVPERLGTARGSAAFPDESSLLIYGRVRSRSGQPLPASSITASETNLATASRDTLASAQSDTSGNYQLWVPSAGAVEILVEHPAHAAVEDQISLPESNRLLRDYVLPEATARIEGRVIDGLQETPVAGAVVEAALFMEPYRRPGPGAGRLAPRRVLTDSSGYFLLDHLPPARVELKAFHSHFLEDIKGVSLSRGDPGPVELRLVAGDLMILHVRDSAGRPIPEPFLLRPEGLRARGDASGTVNFPLIPGTRDFTCTLWAEGYPEQEFSLTSQRRPVEIVLKEGPALGGVVRSDSGIPLPGARVEVYSRDGNRPRSPSRERKVETDASGAFSLHLTRPPVWKVYASADGHVGRWLEFEEEDPPAFVEIELRPARAGIAGQVIDEKGNPVRHFQVTLRSLDGEDERPGLSRQFSDPHGLFSIFELDAGSYELRVTARREDGTELWGGLNPVYVPDGVLQQLRIELEPAASPSSALRLREFGKMLNWMRGSFSPSVPHSAAW